jgi:hypothetical protein
MFIKIKNQVELTNKIWRGYKSSMKKRGEMR